MLRTMGWGYRARLGRTLRASNSAGPYISAETLILAGMVEGSCKSNMGELSHATRMWTSRTYQDIKSLSTH